MRSLIAALAVTMLMFAGLAFADESMSGDAPMHHSGGLGFHSSAAPLGIRWWFMNQKAALDLGFGFTSEQVDTTGFTIGSTTAGDTRNNDWTVDVGLPWLLKSWDKVHFMFRPGFTWESINEVVRQAGPTPAQKETTTLMTGSVALEAEVFLANNVSISATHGIALININPPGSGKSTTDFASLGGNFTQVGFHVYLWGQ